MLLSECRNEGVRFGTCALKEVTRTQDFYSTYCPFEVFSLFVIVAVTHIVDIRIQRSQRQLKPLWLLSLLKAINHTHAF